MKQRSSRSVSTKRSQRSAAKITAKPPAKINPHVAFLLLADHFNSNDLALEFMRCFSGINLFIPNRRVIEKLAFRVKMIQIAPELTKANLAHLSNFHSIPTTVLKKMSWKISGDWAAPQNGKKDCVGQGLLFRGRK